MHRRTISLLLLTLLVATALTAQGSQDSQAPRDARAESGTGGSPLPIPPLADATTNGAGELVYDLDIREGSQSFPGAPGAGARAVETLGYNGDFLGPTIRLSRGDAVRLRVTNGLDEPTTTHWHGALVPAEADGGPHQIIEAGERWEAAFTVSQPAATLWYHPHLDGETARHVYMGLAGMIIVDDEMSERLELPNRYGRDDIPLILQEREFDRDGGFAYRPAMPDVMHGIAGNALLVNGAIEPAFAARDELVRLRVLNGSNSSVLRVSFADGTPFRIIASDGGFLASPVEMTQMDLSPGERFEILVAVDPRSTPSDPMVLEAQSNLSGSYRALSIYADGQLAASAAPPQRLAEVLPIPGPVIERRSFVMSTMGPSGTLTINGETMDMSRIDERVPLDQTELWTIENAAGGMGGRGRMGGGMGGMMAVPHSFHVHGVQFQVESINGRRPPAHLAGWKDTVLLWPDESVVIRVRFADHTGIFMYHCHFLEHEDNGMMGQIMVVARE